jgi:hypothetical protein
MSAIMAKFTTSEFGSGVLVLQTTWHECIWQMQSRILRNIQTYIARRDEVQPAG